MNRLSPDSLTTLPSDVKLPAYSRDTLKTGIVHLGVGAFHRAHQAWYTEQLLNQQGGDWGIVGASLRKADVAEQLNPQQGLYTLVEKSQQSQFQVMGCLQNVLVAPAEPQRLVQQLAEPTVKVVTLTITEKGYCHDPSTGELQNAHPQVEAEISSELAEPVTAIGFLVSGLRTRRLNGHGGLTLLSCDNLPGNGLILRNVVLAMARRLDPSLAAWIEAEVTFPCSMVDRIVPATTDADRALVAEALGIDDQGVVVTEPFSQWVIENNFATEIPDWAAVGALVVDDVTPFEDIKLRLLNGSHSLIAYLGFVAGYDYVHEVVADADFSKLIKAYMASVLPTLDVPQGFDISAYQSQLIERFLNPALQHRTFQIAMDGSQKIPQRWLQSVRDLTTNGGNTDILAMAVAAWIKYLRCARDTGERFTVDDPLAEELCSLATSPDPVAAVLAETRVFSDLGQNPAFEDSVKKHFTLLMEQGNRQSVRAMVAQGAL